MKRRLIEWIVEMKDDNREKVALSIWAKTRGAAARKAFKILLQHERIKRQPATGNDGGWQGVSITAMPDDTL